MRRLKRFLIPNRCDGFVVTVGVLIGMAILTVLIGRYQVVVQYYDVAFPITLVASICLIAAGAAMGGGSFSWKRMVTLTVASLMCFSISIAAMIYFSEPRQPIFLDNSFFGGPPYFTASRHRPLDESAWLMRLLLIGVPSMAMLFAGAWAVVVGFRFAPNFVKRVAANWKLTRARLLIGLAVLMLAISVCDEVANAFSPELVTSHFDDCRNVWIRVPTRLITFL